MVATDQDVGGPEQPFHAGDSLRLSITVREDGTPRPLGGATLSWAVAETAGEAPVLTDDDSGVAVTIVDAGAGEVRVDIESGVTSDLAGYYEHELLIADSDGEETVVLEGAFQVDPRLND